MLGGGCSGGKRGGKSGRRPAACSRASYLFLHVVELQCCRILPYTLLLTDIDSKEEGNEVFDKSQPTVSGKILNAFHKMQLLAVFINSDVLCSVSAMTLLFWFARSYCAYLTFFIEIM
jgi:hypothetical protein